MTHEIELEGYYLKFLAAPCVCCALAPKPAMAWRFCISSAVPGGMALRWMSRLLRTPGGGDNGAGGCGDTVAVPPAATAQATNSGSVTVRGVRDGVQCISCNIPYLVLNHAPVPGQQTDPAESVWKQYADKLIPAGGAVPGRCWPRRPRRIWTCTGPTAPPPKPKPHPTC